MLEPNLVTDAIAASAELPGLHDLGPYPIIQLFGSLVVLGGGLWLYLKAQGGTSSSKSTPSTPLPPGGAGEGVHLYFDGPLKQISDKLAAETALLERLVALHYETREQIAASLQTTRHDVRTAIQEDASESTLENNEIKELMNEVARKLDEVSRDVGKKLGDVSELLIRLDEFVRGRRVK